MLINKDIDYLYIILNKSTIKMSNKERMLDINRETDDQTNRIKMMTKVTYETQNTSNNIMN